MNDRIVVTRRWLLIGTLGAGLVVMALAITLTVTPTLVARSLDTTITVDTFDDEFNDGDDCSLREAIQAANTDSAVDTCPAGSGHDTIVLPAGTYVLTRIGADEDSNATGDLDIVTDTLTVNVLGGGRAVIDGNQLLDRVLHIHSGVIVEIDNVTITGGRTPNGGPGSAGGSGGGIYIASGAVVTLTNNTVIGNVTGDGGDGGAGGLRGGDGGGIYNSGTLVFSYGAVVSNTTGSGGYGTTSGGSGGGGGGISTHNGVLILSYTTVASNTTGGGSNGGSFGGRGGSGGGIYNFHDGVAPEAGAALTLTNCIVNGNSTGNGGSGGTGDGAGGDGGGVYNNNGALVLDHTIVINNITGDGSDGVNRGGNGGRGGGIYNSRDEMGQGDDGMLTLAHCTISGNATGNGGSGAASSGGSGGDGSGIYNYGGLLTLSHTTVASNNSGNGSIGGTWSGDGGRGGGIYNSRDDMILDANGALTLTNCTISGNITGNGGSGGGSDGDGGWGGGIYNKGTTSLSSSTISSNTTGLSSDGGGIYNLQNYTVNLKSTIVANNTVISGQDTDCSGALISHGYNLVEITTTCTISEIVNPGTNIIGQDPILEPLADNGGDTQTHALFSDSPAINTGSCTDIADSLIATDQRGVTRVGLCDVGAYEYARLIYLPIMLRDFQVTKR